MLIPLRVVSAIKADSELKNSEFRLQLALIVASAVHHAMKLADGTVLSYRLLKPSTQETRDIEFPNYKTARIFIRLARVNRQFEILVKLPRSMSITEQIVLHSIAIAHNAASEMLINSNAYDDLAECFLEKMEDAIIDTALASLTEEYWKSNSKPDVFGNIRRFIESLMATKYEGHPSEIGITISRTKSKRQIEPIKIEELLGAKKASIIFSGYRHLLICNMNGEIIRHTTLSPYPDVGLMPKNGALYAAPYEYQPVMRDSHKRNAITFLLTRRRQILVVLEGQIHFIKDAEGWRIFAIDRFLDLLGELLRKNSKKKLSEKNSSILACYLGMLCLTLRERGRGGLFVISKRVIKQKESNNPLPPAEKFFQSLLNKRSIFDIPVSMMCNAAAVDGATLLSWDCMVERFGWVINTEKLKSASEGARTRAAEYISHYGVAIKVSEDGQITLFASGKALMIVK